MQGGYELPTEEIRENQSGGKSLIPNSEVALTK